MFALQTQTSGVYCKGNTPVDLSVGEIQSQRSQWRAYRKPPSLFRIVPSLTPTTSKWGFHMPPRHANGHITTSGDPITSCLVLR